MLAVVWKGLHLQTNEMADFDILKERLKSLPRLLTAAIFFLTPSFVLVTVFVLTSTVSSLMNQVSEVYRDSFRVKQQSI